MGRYVFFLIVLLSACQVKNETGEKDRYAHIQDSKARAIIKRSIQDAGGLNKWESIKQIRYKKNFNLYDSTGAVEKKYVQEHSYNYPENNLEIRSQENDDLIYSRFSEGRYTRDKNGKEVDIDAASLQKSMNSSTYVLGIPYKLVDPGAEIRYMGEEKWNTGIVDVIEVRYDPRVHANHSSKNAWKFYFDKKTARVVGNWIESSDHYNVVENLSYEQVDGLLFHKERKSYRTNSKGEKLYLRADYHYYDYQINK